MKGTTGYSTIVERTWAAHELLRKAGFPADDIFVAIGNVDVVFVQLLGHGVDGKFSISVAKLGEELSAEGFEAQWMEFVQKFNANVLTDDDLAEIYENALGTWGGAVSFLAALSAKGIMAPCMGGLSPEVQAKAAEAFAMFRKEH